MLRALKEETVNSERIGGRFIKEFALERNSAKREKPSRENIFAKSQR